MASTMTFVEQGKHWTARQIPAGATFGPDNKAVNTSGMKILELEVDGMFFQYYPISFQTNDVLIATFDRTRYVLPGTRIKELLAWSGL